MMNKHLVHSIRLYIVADIISRSNRKKLTANYKLMVNRPVDTKIYQANAFIFKNLTTMYCRLEIGAAVKL